MTLYLFIFVLAVFLGFEPDQQVPSQLHTPLMSGTNAISGISIVGAIAATAAGGTLGTVRHRHRAGYHQRRRWLPRD